MEPGLSLWPAVGSHLSRSARGGSDALVEFPHDRWIRGSRTPAPAAGIISRPRPRGPRALGLRVRGIPQPAAPQARLFRETLGEDEFAGVFAASSFAVTDDPNARRRDSPEGNYLPFAREFGGPNPSKS